MKTQRKQTTLRQFVSAVMLAITLGAAVVGPVGAEKPYEMPAGLDQNGFVRNCRNAGGTTERVGTRTVKCTLPSGSTVTCNFITRECSGTAMGLGSGNGSTYGDAAVNGTFSDIESTSPTVPSTGFVIETGGVITAAPAQVDEGFAASGEIVVDKTNAEPGRGGGRARIETDDSDGELDSTGD